LLPEYRYRKLLRATFIARFYSIIFPGQIAGDVVKAYRLGRQSARVGHAESATALDRVIGLFVLFVISAVASAYSPRLPMPLRVFFVAGAIIVFVCGVVAGSHLFRKVVVERLPVRPQGRIGAFVRDFSIALNEHLHRPGRLLMAMSPALVFHAVAVTMQALLGNDLVVRLGWADWTVVYAGVSLVTLLPISVAGLGLREGGYVGMLALFGYKASVALSLSFAILGFSLIGAVIGGSLEVVRMMTQHRAPPQHGDRTAKRS
jgi:uncharacterized membrane protein YbhN (UPF0104 family)